MTTWRQPHGNLMTTQWEVTVRIQSVRHKTLIRTLLMAQLGMFKMTDVECCHDGLMRLWPSSMSTHPLLLVNDCLTHGQTYNHGGSTTTTARNPEGDKRVREPFFCPNQTFSSYQMPCITRPIDTCVALKLIYLYPNLLQDYSICLNTKPKTKTFTLF